MGSPRVFGLLSIGGGVVDPLFLMQVLCLPPSSLLAHHPHVLGGRLQQRRPENLRYRLHALPPGRVHFPVASLRVFGAKMKPAPPSDGTILAPATGPDLGSRRSRG